MWSKDQRRATVSKAECRAGISPAARRSVWLKLGIGSGEEAADATVIDNYYRAALREVFGNTDPAPSRIFKIPFLGVEPAVLPEEATALLLQPSVRLSAAHDRIVCVLAQLHGLRFCPMVPNLALLLLQYLSEPEAFAVLESIIQRTHQQEGASTLPLVHLSKGVEVAAVKTFRTLVKGYFPKLHEHMERLGSPVRGIIASWFRGFFSSWLPPSDVHRVIDSYLWEGPKILVRFGLALLRLTKRQLKTTTSATSFDRTLRAWVAHGVKAASEARAAAARGQQPPPPPPQPLPGFEHVYTFELLSRTAFSDLSGLSRESITKLMGRYLARGGTLPSGDSTNTRSDGTTDLDPKLVPNRSGASVLRGVGGAAAIPTEALPLAPAPPPSTGDPADMIPSWYNVKLTGVACRLMTPDFRAADALALLRRLAHIQDRDEGWCPQLYTPQSEDGGATSSSGSSGGAGSMPSAAAAAYTGVTSVHSAKKHITVAHLPSSGLLYSLTASPSLSALSTFLPDKLAHHNWTCVYSSDVQGYSLQTLYRCCAGLAPLLVLVQASSRGSTSSSNSSSSGGGGTPAPGLQQQQQHGRGGVSSSSLPVFGFFTSHGLPVNGQYTRPSPPVRGAGSGGGFGGESVSAVAPWTGGVSDFMFQLLPELARFGVSSTYESVASPGPDAQMVPAAAEDLAGVGHRTLLRKERFICACDDRLLVGGHPHASSSFALKLAADLQSCTVSRDLLHDMSVPLPPMTPATASGSGSDDVPLDLLAVEVYAFTDRGGRFVAAEDGGVSLSAAAAAAARAAATETVQHYRAGLKRYWQKVLNDHAEALEALEKQALSHAHLRPSSRAGGGPTLEDVLRGYADARDELQLQVHAGNSDAAALLPASMTRLEELYDTEGAVALGLQAGVDSVVPSTVMATFNVGARALPEEFAGTGAAARGGAGSK